MIKIQVTHYLKLALVVIALISVQDSYSQSLFDPYKRDILNDPEEQFMYNHEAIKNGEAFNSKEWIKSLYYKELDLRTDFADRESLILSSSSLRDLKRNSCDILKAFQDKDLKCDSLDYVKNGKRYEVNMAKHLPKRIRALLLNENRPEIVGPNCFNAALFAKGLNKTIRSTQGEELRHQLRNNCSVVSNKEDLKPGDMGVIKYYNQDKSISSGMSLMEHAFIYINDDLVFEKATAGPEDIAKFSTTGESLVGYHTEILRETDLFVGQDDIDYSKLRSIEQPFTDPIWDEQGNLKGYKEVLKPALGAYIQYYNCKPSSEIQINNLKQKINDIELEVSKAVLCKKSVSKDLMKRLSNKLNILRKEISSNSNTNGKEVSLMISMLDSLNSDTNIFH